MRTAFKVATVFTGSVACAAAFVPAAAATTVQTQQIKPDATVSNCPPFMTIATHLEWPSTAHHGPTCVSSYGTASLHGAAFTFLCAGGWSGYVIANGHRVNFVAGSYASFSPPARITKIDLTGDHGSPTC